MDTQTFLREVWDGIVTHLDGGNSALVIGVLVVTNLGPQKHYFNGILEPQKWP